MQHMIISTIGPPMVNDTDPIYEVAMRFPPKEILLVSSDEPDHPKREPTSKNIDSIRRHFERTKVPVLFESYNLHDFDNNVVTMASIIIGFYQDNQQKIVLDLSAGRGSIRQALSRAGDLAVNYIHNFHDPFYSLNCTIRSKNQQILIYEVGNSGIPSKRDTEVLLLVDQPVSQTVLAQRLKWNNQSEVSKSLRRLSKLGLIEVEGHRKRILTQKGERIRDLIRKVGLKK